MKKQIYADHAASSPLSRTAYEKMKPWLEERFENPSALYGSAFDARKAVSEARETIAGCIGARPDEICFTSGGSESDNWAVKGSAFLDPEKRPAVTCAAEHHAVLRPFEAIGKMGYPVAVLSPSPDGVLSPDALEAALSRTPGARMVSVMTVNNELGTLQPIRALSDIARRWGALFHTDAVQAVGHIPVDVGALGVDLLSASAHKFNGPRGVGFLYIRRGVRIAPLIDGGAQERNLRAGTENTAGIVGMAAALEENCAHLSERRAHITRLETLLTDLLREEGVRFSVNGGETRVPGILSLAFGGTDGEVLLNRLDLEGICVSAGAACSSRDTEISHVLKAVGLEERLALGTIRISLGRENTEDEVRQIGKAIGRIVRDR